MKRRENKKKRLQKYGAAAKNRSIFASTDEHKTRSKQENSTFSLTP